MSQDRRPVIGFLFGDCNGIGPEITAKVLAKSAERTGPVRAAEKTSFSWDRILLSVWRLT